MSRELRRIQRVAAYAVVTDRCERVLLCRLTAVTSHPGWWTLPGGGVDHGEHPEDAMVREVREETGLDVDTWTLLGVDSVTRRVRDDFHAIRLVYRATVRDECAPLVPESGGSTDQARWVERSELSGLQLADLVPVGLGLRFTHNGCGTGHAEGG